MRAATRLAGAACFAVATWCAALGAAGCERLFAPRCDDVPTTADGCRERCHDRGAEMTFFRYDPGTYRCDALCLCGAGGAE